MNPITRRRFLATGSAAAGLALADSARGADAAPARRVIVLLLVGGPSQLETFDPKPDALTEVRGPFGSIASSVVGVRVGEHLPRLARQAHRYALVRTVHHDAAPVHESGMQLLQTGHLGGQTPHFGDMLARRHGEPAPFVVLPNRLGNLGLNVANGQDANVAIDANFTHHLSAATRDRYGKTAFGDCCARSLQLVEHGTRCVVVNMFDSIYDRLTWDCHATRQCLSSTLADYRRVLCPTFDHACAALLDDLHERGMLEETLVVAMGEMGRTPYLNANGGRDHWPHCWSILLAGGGVRGGQVIGASDRLASEPARRPVRCAEVFASISHAMGLDGGANRVRELFE
ncbi:MAG TPA: DUF1501 domain-containing protein [Gemmataceae bacterium]|nr:DUF1501 domain-containing protein [Gemmataceae bacterium]